LEHVNGYFNPDFAAVLHSELTDGVNHFQVILDTGCSFAMTHDLADLITDPMYSDWGTVQTASTSLPLTAFGTINWTIQTTTGVNFLLTVPGFYVPGSNVHLLSPQDYARYHNLSTLTDQFGGNSKEFWMMLQDGTSKVLAPIASGGKLPVMIAKHTFAHNLRQGTCYSSEFTNVLDVKPDLNIHPKATSVGSLPSRPS
jgi:hypothetical protein